MAFKVYILDGRETSSARQDTSSSHEPSVRVDALQQALALSDGPAIAVERVAVGDHVAESLRELLADESALGAEVPFGAAREAAQACSGLSSFALHSGLATAVVRRGHREARLAARDLLAKAIVAALAGGGVGNVRTALILGSGAAARSSLAALHELGCNRFLIGYGDPQRRDDLARQVAHWKRQVHYFPLDEMEDFFAWAGSADIYESRALGTAATDKEHKLRAEREDRQDPRRWELIINATPVGGPGVEPANLLPDSRFLACSGRVLDLAGDGRVTDLLALAQQLGLPTIGAGEIADHWASQAAELWRREYRRRIEGAPEEPEHHPRQESRRFVLKRR